MLITPGPSTHVNKSPKSERRSEVRRLVETFYSVEFFIQQLYRHYQFKLRDFSDQGLCILVREDSDVLPHLSVGDRLEMKFRSDRHSGKICAKNVEIRHITEAGPGKHNGHRRVGFSILESHTDEQ